jgi:hypothetical protein
MTVALAAVAIGLTACGDKDGGSDGTAPGGGNGANGLQAYISCLSEHGVTLNLPQGQGNRPTDQPSFDPNRTPGQGGGNGQGSGFPGGGAGGGLLGEQAPEGVDQATWDAARTACESVRPTAGPGGQGGPGGGFDNSAFTAYRNCLSDHGVTMSQGPGNLSTEDPKVAAAVKACEALRPTGAPRPQPSQSN